MATTTADLSVVVACLSDTEPIDACLIALEHSASGLSVEIILTAGGVSEDRLRTLKQRHPAITCVRCPKGTLVPELWATGLYRARGHIVSFTLAQCCVSETWAHAVINGIAQGATGVGGPIELSAGSRVTDWAVFYLRYSAFVPAHFPDGPVASNIAGDNAAYARSALDRHADSFASGFWEIEFHQLLRADGGVLVGSSNAMTFFRGGSRYRQLLAHRFFHGRQFAAGRTAAKIRPAWALVVFAPLVPLVLAARAGFRILPLKHHRTRFLASLPALLGLATAWAAGEAWGAVAGSRRGRVAQPQPKDDAATLWRS